MEQSAPPTTVPNEPKHIDPNDLTVMEGAVRAVEVFMATENSRDAYLKVRVDFDLIPPEARDFDFKSTSNLAIDISAVRNLPRARRDVLMKHEENKKRVNAPRIKKQSKCPTSTRSVTSSASVSSIADRTPAIRQAAGGDDSQSSSSTATAAPFYEGAKSALKDTILMGTPHDPIVWNKLPASPTPRTDETPKKDPAQQAISIAIPSATVFAVKGACTNVENAAGAAPTPVLSATKASAESIPFGPSPPENSPLVQRRIEKMQEEERRKKKKREEEEKMRETSSGTCDLPDRVRNAIPPSLHCKHFLINSIDASEFCNDYEPKPKKYYRRKKRKTDHSISRSLSSHLHTIGSAARDGAAAATERLRQSTGWITDLYYHYLLRVLVTLGRAFPAMEAPEPPSSRRDLPYRLHRAIRHALPSAEVFAVKYSTNVVKKKKKEVKKKVEETVKTAPTQRSPGVSPRKEETPSKTAEEISSGRDTVSKREPESPFKKSDDGLPTAIPTPTEQSIGFREVQPSQRSDTTTHIKDEDTLNNVKSIEDDDCYTKRTESDTSIISNDPIHPEASFDFKRVGEKRTEISFQILVHKNKIFSPIVTLPSRSVCNVSNLSMEPI